MKLLQQQTFSYCYFVALLCIVAENIVTDRQADRLTNRVQSPCCAYYVRVCCAIAQLLRFAFACCIYVGDLNPLPAELPW